MNNKRYQHILFDLDGTLTDPMIGITSSVKYALSYFRVSGFSWLVSFLLSV